MFKNQKAFLLLAIASIIIISGDFLVMRYKVLFGGDEIISYLCATGNAGNYEEVLYKYPPYGKLVDAAEWKKYFEITEPNCFKKIATDLCTTDLHPPLYFWLLHIFVLKFGMHIYTGILLNLLLQLFSLFFIFKLGSLVFEDKNKGAFAALIWAVSPACMVVSMNARPYELFELVGVIYFVNFFLWHKKATKLNAFLLAIIGTFGLLTNYTFIYLIASCGLFLLLKFKKIGWRNILAFAIAAFVSFELMALIHPCYTDSFLLQQTRAQVFSLHELPLRILKTVLSFVEFIIPVLSLKQPQIHFSSTFIFTAISILLFIILIGFYFRKQIIKTFQAIVKTNFKTLFATENIQLILIIFIILSCAILLPYLFFITPFHAMGGQYLVLLYPLMAILLATFLFSFAKNIQTFFSGILFAGSVCVLVIMLWWNQSWYNYLIEDVQKSKVIVINNLDRRAFPRLIPYLKPGQQILMDENAVYENDSLMQTLLEHKPLLMIYGNQSRKAGEKYGAKCHTLFDANDGVVFYAKFFDEEEKQPFTH